MKGSVYEMFVPKMFSLLKTYNRKKLLRDVTSGVIVGIIALPLSIALAIASGVSPEKGLITAIIGGFVAALLSGSRVQVSGPTGAFVVIVLGIINDHGLSGLIAATFMAGIFLVAMGLLKMGSLIKYIPYPITTGFTCGIAVTIFSTQIEDFLGLEIAKVPSEFIDKWVCFIKNINTTSLITLGLGVLTILIIQLWPKVSKKIPGTLIAIIVTTVLAIIFDLDVRTIGSEFNEIKGSLPAPKLPSGLSLDAIKALLPSAFAIAFLGSIESLLSAVVADGMIGSTHNSNVELISQGAANIFSSLFGGIPVTGAIARTAANVKNGGRSPVAAMVHSVSLLIMMLFLMPYVKYVPMTTLAGILIIVAYNMGEWEYFKTIPKAPKSDSLVFITTFLLTVLFDLVLAIEVGMVMAAFLFMRRMAEVSSFKLNTPDNDDNDAPLDLQLDENNVMIYEIKGPFFFGAADNFLKTYKQVRKMPKVLILELSHVPFVDTTGHLALTRLHKMCSSQGTKIILVGLQQKTHEILDKFGFTSKIGSENIFADTDAALAHVNT